MQDTVDYTYKLLTKYDLSNFLDFYNSIANLDDYKGLTLAKQSLEKDIPEIYIAGEYSNGTLITIMLGFSINAVWSQTFSTFRNILPYWVLGTHLSRDVLSKNVGTYFKRGETLTLLLANKFEELGYDSFYVVRKVPSRINITTARQHISRYGIPSSSNLDFVIETILYEDFIYKTLPVLYKTLIHPTLEHNKCFVICKFNLTEEYRLIRSTKN